MAQSIHNGITSSTKDQFQLDAGVLVLGRHTSMADVTDSDIICATSGGGTIEVTHTTHTISVDGAPTNTMGLYRKDADTAKADFTAITLTDNALGMAILGATKSTDSEGVTSITAIRDVFDEDYRDVTWMGTLSNGDTFGIQLFNALCTSGFSLSVKDKSEGTFKLTLEANYDMADLNGGCCMMFTAPQASYSTGEETEEE